MMTYENQRSLVKATAEQLALSPHDAEALYWAHEVAMRSDPATGRIVYEDGHADFSSWMKATSEAKPYLVGKREPVQAKPAPTTADTTVSGIMYAAKTDPAAMATLRSKLGLDR